MPVPTTARAPVTLIPPLLQARADLSNAQRQRDGLQPEPPISILCRVPTPFERDSFAAALVRGGVIHYSQKQLRDLLIAGISYLFPDEFDEKLEMMQNLWQEGEAVLKRDNLRRQKYDELIEKNGVLPPHLRMTDAQMEAELQEIQADIVLPERDRARIVAMQQDVTARYAPLQMAFADLAEQDAKRRWICVQTYVTGWTGLEHQPDGNGHGGITREEAEYLRREIGAESFDHIADFCFAMTTLDEDEEKNLDSLIASFSAPTGSRQRLTAMSDQDQSTGSSTSEPSGETLDSASPPTTDSSSSSGTTSETKTDGSEPTQTAAA